MLILLCLNDVPSSIHAADSVFFLYPRKYKNVQKKKCLLIRGLFDVRFT